jgi:hypothetical protein
MFIKNIEENKYSDSRHDIIGVFAISSLHNGYDSFYFFAFLLGKKLLIIVSINGKALKTTLLSDTNIVREYQISDAVEGSIVNPHFFWNLKFWSCALSLYGLRVLTGLNFV